MLLVDHNVKSARHWSTGYCAMYLGEEIVTGRADEVMRNETVRRVYLGGAIETSARPETEFKDKVPLLAGRKRQRFLRQGAGAGECVDPRRIRANLSRWSG